MNERIRWLDTAKGVGIFLVVLGHCLISSMRSNTTSCSLVYEFIYSFHMPFFVFLSGHSFSLSEEKYMRMKPAAFFLKKAKVFLLPYIVYNLLVYLFFSICNQIDSLSQILFKAGYGSLSFGSWLFGLSTGGNLYCYPTWYLYAIFFYSILAYVILRFFSKNRNQQRIASVLITLLLLMAHFFSPAGALIGLRDITYFSLWFFLGWQTHGFLMKYRLGLPCVLIPAALFFMNYFSLLPQLPSILLHSGKIVLRIIGTLGLVSLAPSLKGIIERFFHFCGIHSMEIYLFHQPFIGSCIGSLLFGYANLNPWLTVSITVSLSFLLPLTAGHFIRKSKLLRTLFSI